MDWSLLPRLPDILGLARERARELLAAATTADPLGEPASRAPQPTDGNPIHLLHGDELAAMLCLFSEHRPEGNWRTRIPLIWLTSGGLNPPTRDPATDSTAATAKQHLLSLVELTVRLFVARELMPHRGLLALSVDQDPDQCIAHLLGAVLGHPRSIPPAPAPATGAAPADRVYLVGPVQTEEQGWTAGPGLLRQLADSATRPGDAILVALSESAHPPEAPPPHRHWFLIQPDDQRFTAWPEQLIRDRLRQDGSTRMQTLSHWWASWS